MDLKFFIVSFSRARILIWNNERFQLILRLFCLLAPAQEYRVDMRFTPLTPSKEGGPIFWAALFVKHAGGRGKPLPYGDCARTA
jgi:hypothetical protein